MAIEINHNQQVRYSGRGVDFNPCNKFDSKHIVTEHAEGLDEMVVPGKTIVMPELAKSIVNSVNSPDIPFSWSVNPYRGCEHGCTYCYARNTHPYNGYSSGLDFESRLFVKTNASSLLESKFRSALWRGSPIVLSGNTDCYQPIEAQFRITRSLLDVCLRFRNPVAIITKNDLVLRDIDLLLKLNENRLVKVILSITTLDEDLRRQMEPRTATTAKRFAAVETLSRNGIPVSVMIAPVIPALNHVDIPHLVELASQNGAESVAYTLVRLNGQLPEIFSKWIVSKYPQKAKKVLAAIASCRGGKLGDNKFGRRMRGEGPVASAISQLFRQAKKKYFGNRKSTKLNSDLYCPPDGRQLALF